MATTRSGQAPLRGVGPRSCVAPGPDDAGPPASGPLIAYPTTTGRNFDEVLRVVDSLQLTANHAVATPAQWQQGENVIIAGSVSNEAAKEKYPDGWDEPKPYIRIVAAPKA